MPGKEDPSMADATEGSKGDIIARAKGEVLREISQLYEFNIDFYLSALEFLAITLERLDDDVLIAAHSK